MMQRIPATLATAALLALSAPALARAEGRFDRASAAYAEERFDDAARELESLIAERGYSPAVLHALGDAYARQGETGLAVLAYERSRLLEPNDPAVTASLRAARRSAGLAPPHESAIEALAALWPARRWLSAGAIALGLFCLGALAAGALRRARWAGVALALSSFVAVAACGAALWIGALGVDRAVVIAADVTARVSPFAQAEELFALREGEIVRIESAHGEHVRIAMPDGSQGWVARDAVAPIVPGAVR